MPYKIANVPKEIARKKKRATTVPGAPGVGSLIGAGLGMLCYVNRIKKLNCLKKAAAFFGLKSASGRA